jgi:hypothetical protein
MAVWKTRVTSSWLLEHNEWWRYFEPRICQSLMQSLTFSIITWSWESWLFCFLCIFVKFRSWFFVRNHSKNRSFISCFFLSLLFNVNLLSQIISYYVFSNKSLNFSSFLSDDQRSQEEVLKHKWSFHQVNRWAVVLVNVVSSSLSKKLSF